MSTVIDEIELGLGLKAKLEKTDDGPQITLEKTMTPNAKLHISLSCQQWGELQGWLVLKFLTWER